MLKAIIFDLDDTLLWDDRSVDEALKITCDYAAEQQTLDPKALEKLIIEKAPAIYATFATIDYVKDIGIGVFEALWGDFQGEGEQEAKMRKMAPDYRLQTWNGALRDLGIEDHALAKTLGERFKEERKKHIYLYEETLDVLEALKGAYKLLVLTNGSPSLQRTKLSLSPELKPYMDDIVISGDFGSGKPNPAIFKYALDKLGVTKDEAIMVGDNLLTDILGASNIEMRSVWINHNDIKVEEAKHTYEITRLQEILPIIRELS